MRGQKVQKTLQEIEEKGEELKEQQAKLINKYQELQVQHTHAKGQLEMFLEMITQIYTLPEGAVVNMTDGTIQYPTDS
jgi:chromosome segregation ATPase